MLTEGDRLPESACVHLRYAYDRDAGFWYLSLGIENTHSLEEVREQLSYSLTIFQFEIVINREAKSYVSLGFDIREALRPDVLA